MLLIPEDWIAGKCCISVNIKIKGKSPGTVRTKKLCCLQS